MKHSLHQVLYGESGEDQGVQSLLEEMAPLAKFARDADSISA